MLDLHTKKKFQFLGLDFSDLQQFKCFENPNIKQTNIKTVFLENCVITI